ncbi:MAG TPA: hypothetical protein VLG44_08575 [Chlamydiales bacterium]|nr:hypothetical protein [Chlamydiales bacterium]
MEQIKDYSPDKKNRKVLRSYLESMLGATILGLLALAAARYVNQLHIFSADMIEVMQVVSLIIGAAPLYGFKEGEVKNSSTDKSYSQLFKVLSSFDFFLAVWAYQLKS